jgi:hypothetical protein
VTVLQGEGQTKLIDELWTDGDFLNGNIAVNEVHIHITFDPINVFAQKFY